MLVAACPDLAHAVDRLREGGLVAFPTETVYGLGAVVWNRGAVRRVFALKGRPATNPLIVHVADEAMAASVAAEWPAAAGALARAFWPGPLSIVVPKSPRVPPEVSAGAPTVALRCPDHEFTLALLRALGQPLVGPSANPSGGISPTTAAHVRAAFAPDDVLVLDGGPCVGGIESTVVLLAESGPRILRPGLISADEIAAVLGVAVASAEAAPGHAAPSPAAGVLPLPSPGMLPRHYAPRAPAQLVARLGLDTALSAGPPAAVLARPATPVLRPHGLIEMPSTARAYAASLYCALRRADELRPARIIIEDPRPAHLAPDDPEAPVWAAILDRLVRATTPEPTPAAPPPADSENPSQPAPSNGPPAG